MKAYAMRSDIEMRRVSIMGIAIALFASVVGFREALRSMKTKKKGKEEVVGQARELLKELKRQPGSCLVP